MFIIILTACSAFDGMTVKINLNERRAIFVKIFRAREFQKYHLITNHKDIFR